MQFWSIYQKNTQKSIKIDKNGILEVKWSIRVNSGPPIAIGGGPKRSIGIRLRAKSDPGRPRRWDLLAADHQSAPFWGYFGPAGSVFSHVGEILINFTHDIGHWLKVFQNRLRARGFFHFLSGLEVLWKPEKWLKLQFFAISDPKRQSDPKSDPKVGFSSIFRLIWLFDWIPIWLQKQSIFTSSKRQKVTIWLNCASSNSKS